MKEELYYIDLVIASSIFLVSCDPTYKKKKDKLRKSQNSDYFVLFHSQQFSKKVY